MKKYVFPLLALATLLLVGCNSNPAWEGPNPKSKPMTLAAETCKCLYEMAGQQPGWNLDAIMEEVQSIKKKTKRTLQDAVLESENPEVLKALQGEEEFSLMFDDCECMSPIQDALLEQGVTFESMMDQLDDHCLLGAFYN